MKRLYILLIIGLLAALAISAGVSHDPGYVRISVGHWLIETNLWVMGLLNLILITAIVVSLSLVRKVRYSQSSLFSWLKRIGGSRAKQKTEQGFIALLEGNWLEAKKLLGRSAEKSENPLVNYLAAAHAATEQGNSKDAEQYLQKAYASNHGDDLAIGITQAQIQLQKNQLELCLATLVRLRKQNEHHPYILRLLKTVYLRLEDWQQLVNLIPELKRLEPERKDELRDIEKQAWQKLFEQQTEELKRKNNPANSAETLANLWRKVPDSLRFNVDFIATYAQQLIKLACESEAEVLIRKALSKEWHPRLVELYGLVASDNVSEQLITAEAWLKQRPNDATLLLSLGRLALRNELWGKAWEYFSASHQLQASQQCLAELCRLAPHINEDPLQNQTLMNGLLSSLELPQLPMPK